MIPEHVPTASLRHVERPPLDADEAARLLAARGRTVTPAEAVDALHAARRIARLAVAVARRSSLTP